MAIFLASESNAPGILVPRGTTLPMRGPIVGALAGTVLKGFRVELDYAHETLYLSRP